MFSYPHRASASRTAVAAVATLSRRAGPCAVAAAVLLALAACGGDSDSTAPPPPPEQRASGLAVSRPGELTAFVKDRLRSLNAQGRLPSAGSVFAAMPTTAVGMVAAVGAPAAAEAAPAPQTTPRSNTQVQEDGVDEADLIKTDGSFLYTLQPQTSGALEVVAYERAADGRASARSSALLATDGAAGINASGMMLSDDHRSLAVINQRWTATPGFDICAGLCTAIAPQWMSSSVNVQRVDVSNPAAATAGERISIDGYLVDSRRIGDALYVVTSHRPVLSALQLPANATSAEREALIARLSVADLLPRMRRNGGASEPLLAETDCFVQAANASTDVQFTTVTVFDLRSATLARTSRCFVGGAEALYMSSTSLVVATTRWVYPDVRIGAPLIYPGEIKTDIHLFGLNDGAVTYRGTGQVDGHLGWDNEKKSYRLSEFNGDLRVLSYTGQFGWFMAQDASSVAPSPAKLTVLRAVAGDPTLQVVATLPNAARPAAIGKPGEQVYAVRFLGDRGYVVTFRRTDPLYVLDLSNPADPKAVGELEIAGFSDYLYPLPNHTLLGVGRDADSSGRATGLKLALFDVADPSRPSQRASLTLGAAGSWSALNYSRHGLNMLLVGPVARVALPVILTSTPYAGWRHGLQRLEVDTAAGTIKALDMAGASEGSNFEPLWLERSAQIGDSLYYLSGGRLSSYNW